MLTLRVFVCFCIMAAAAVAQPTPLGSPSVISVEDPAKYDITPHPVFKEMKARAERAEITAEYWKAIAERNELAIRLMQSEAQLNEAKKKIESLEKKS